MPFSLFQPPTIANQIYHFLFNVASIPLCKYMYVFLFSKATDSCGKQVFGAYDLHPRYHLCEYVTLHGKRDTAEGLRLWSPKIRKSSWIIGVRVQLITWTAEQEAGEIKVRGSRLGKDSTQHHWLWRWSKKGHGQGKQAALETENNGPFPTGSQQGNRDLSSTTSWNWIMPTTWMSLDSGFSPRASRSKLCCPTPWFRPWETQTKKTADATRVLIYRTSTLATVA